MVLKLFLRQVERDRVNEEYSRSILSSLSDAINFSIVSAWHDNKTVDSNRIAHRQLEDNFKNLGYWYTETSYTYSQGEEEKEGRAFIVKNSNLHEMMFLGLKYEQTTLIYHDKDRFEVLDTKVGRVYFQINAQINLVSDLQKVFINYLFSRNSNAEEIKSVSLDVRHIPSGLEALEHLRDKQGLPAARWVTLF